MFKNILLSFLCLFVVVTYNASTNAQTPPPQDGDVEVNVAQMNEDVQKELPFLSPIQKSGNKLVDEMVDRIELVRPRIDPTLIPSMFFTPSEESLIQEARLGLTTRAPTDSEIRRAEDGTVIKGPRELSLGGIVYLSAGDWTIWLNGQKVTPDRIPPEVLDIVVRKNTVKIKWFDEYTNQIFPIKLRSHQRFNIDTRVFLPG